MDVLSPNDENQFLFHYTSLGTALEHILPEPPRIRFSRFSNTADPRENKDWNFHITTPGELAAAPVNVEAEIGVASEKIQAGLRVLCLTEDSLPKGGETPAETRGFGLSRMWDRYSDKHKGVCLAFDRKALGEAILEAIPREYFFPGVHHYWQIPVTYRVLAERAQEVWDLDGDKVSQVGAERTVLSHLVMYHEGILFSKSMDWAGEREYRWVFFLAPGAPEFKVPIESALRAIFLGVDCPHVYDRSIQAVCPAGASIFRMQWNWGHFLTPI